MHFEYDSENPTNGILYYLYQHHNKYYQNFVQVSATSWANEQRKPSYAVDFNNGAYWITNNTEYEESLTISFPLHKIALSGYLLKTSSYETQGYFPKKWYFAYSTDGFDYLNKSEVTDTNNALNCSLCSLLISYTTEATSYFRLFPKNNTFNNYNGFDLNQIELFGDLYFVDICKTCAKPYFHLSLYMFMIFLTYKP